MDGCLKSKYSKAQRHWLIYKYTKRPFSLHFCNPNQCDCSAQTVVHNYSQFQGHKLILINNIVTTSNVRGSTPCEPIKTSTSASDFTSLAMLQVSVLVPSGVKKSSSAEYYENLPIRITITYHSYMFVCQHRLLLYVLWCLVVMMSAFTASVELYYSIKCV